MKLVRVRRRHGAVADGNDFHAAIEFRDMLFGFIPGRAWTATCPHGHRSADAAITCAHEQLMDETEMGGPTT